MLSRILFVVFALVLWVGVPATPAAAEVGMSCKCLPDPTPPVVHPICHVSSTTAFVYMSPPPTFVQATASWCRQNGQFFWLSPTEAAGCFATISCLCSNPAPGPEALACGDGVDNDCDGDMDCDDLDCITAPECSGGTGTGTGF